MGLPSRLPVVLAICASFHIPSSSSSRTDRKSIPNSVVGIITSCSASTLNITVEMREPFKGVVYARGFPLECSSARKPGKSVQTQQLKTLATTQSSHDQGALSPLTTATLSLPASECGVRMVPSKSDDGITLVVVVEVQLDRHLQQQADTSKTVSCRLAAKDSGILMKSPALTLNYPANARTGRNKNQGIASANFDEDGGTMQRARAVLEIVGTSAATSGQTDPGVIAVGEDTTLMVTGYVPPGVGSRVVNCVAHDGAGDALQRLTDASGCPMDESILPALSPIKSREQLRALKPPPNEAVSTDNQLGDGTTQNSTGDEKQVFGGEAGGAPKDGSAAMAVTVVAARFSAFKFPDRSRLHLRCQLQLCAAACPQVDCAAKGSNSRQDRRIKKGSRGEILGQLQVFNSVEVLAPGIEADDRGRLTDIVSDAPAELKKGPIPSPSISQSEGPTTFCLSPPRMALVFATLGSVFLCAVAVALVALVRSRRSCSGSSGSTDGLRRQLLRMRDSASSQSMSEHNALVHVQDSPFLGHSAPPVAVRTHQYWTDKTFN